VADITSDEIEAMFDMQIDQLINAIDQMLKNLQQMPQGLKVVSISLLPLVISR